MRAIIKARIDSATLTIRSGDLVLVREITFSTYTDAYRALHACGELSGVMFTLHEHNNCTGESIFYVE